MWQSDKLSDYAEAGRMRLRDAQELLQPPTFLPDDKMALTRHLRGAVYLAGYAVECALRAYIIVAAKTETFSEAIRMRCAAGEKLDFGGGRSHNLRLLLLASGLMPTVELDPILLKAWQYCQKWGPDQRYRGMWAGKIDAKRKITAMAQFSQWVDSQRAIL